MMRIRKDSEIFLRKLLEYNKETGKDSFKLNYKNFTEIPSIETVIFDILKDLIDNNCLASQSRVDNLEGDISIYLTLDGIKYFDEVNSKEYSLNYIFNVSGGMVGIANDNGSINAVGNFKDVEKNQDTNKIVSDKKIQNDIKMNNNKDITIFISYSSKNEVFVDELDNKLQAYGYNVVRDVRDLEYTQHTKDFMKRIRKTDYSIIVLSDSFFKSENCMYEIFEFIKDDNYKDRIIPVITESAKDILSSDKGIVYTFYWKKEEEKFKEKLKKIDEESKVGYIEELKHLSSIKDSIGEVISIFRNMKMFDESDADMVDKILKYIDKNIKKKIL